MADQEKRLTPGFPDAANADAWARRRLCACETCGCAMTPPIGATHCIGCQAGNHRPPQIRPREGWAPPDPPPSTEETSLGQAGERELCAYARAYAHTPSPSSSPSLSKEGKEGKEASDNRQASASEVCA